MTTLDALIERHGVPDFVKVDVEGYELRSSADAMKAYLERTPRDVLFFGDVYARRTERG